MLDTIKDVSLYIIIIWWAINTLLFFFVLIVLIKTVWKVNSIVEDVKYKYTIINEIIMMPLKVLSRFFKD